MSVQLAVIGAGPGGYAAAVRAAQLGAEVTLIEKDQVGGICLHWGCIPSKVMRTAAAVLETTRRAGEFGIALDGTGAPDMPGLMQRKERIIGDQVQGLLRLFQHHGIRHLKGLATLQGPNRIHVQTREGAREDVFWDRLILATGSRPAQLPDLPFNGRTILSSDHALGLGHVPASMLIVGGGVIGCEFASIFSGLGSAVTVVEAMPGLLPIPGVDEDCVKTLLREMKKRKIQVKTNAGITDIREKGGGCEVSIGPSPFDRGGTRPKRPAPECVETECVLICVGRRPNTDGLGLESLGITTEPGEWISVDPGMQTPIPGVYAIGDALGPSHIMLAHVASTEGRIAAENAMGNHSGMDYEAVPAAIFTSPEIGGVGRTESEAREAGYRVRSDTVLFRNVGKAQVIGEIAGQAKLVWDEQTGRVLGAHLIGPGATELVAEATLAIRAGCTVEDVAQTIHAHPTLAEIFLEVAGKAAGRPLHG
jgi:dihydrolipoamide dehydrogenase